MQLASGRFSVTKSYLNSGAAIEVKLGQGAKPGIGGHLPASKVNSQIAATRMIPQGTDAISPSTHHDIYGLQDLKQLIDSIKQCTQHKIPVIVKVAAVHNCADIAAAVARCGADMLAIDGYSGGTGAAPKQIRDNVGIPIELAVAATDTRLRSLGIRQNISILAGGSIRCSSDIIKILALGADCAFIGTAALAALGCTLCGDCFSGRCAWGIATQNPTLADRLNADDGAAALGNLLTAWRREIKEIMGCMGINSVAALVSNRDILRGININQAEQQILGVKYAGE